MKNMSKTIISILVLGLILVFSIICNYEIFDNQGYNYEKMGNHDYTKMKSPKVASTGINITSPGNITYFDPMEGYHQGTFGFENDESGSVPDGWIADGTGPDWQGKVRVVDSYAGHNKVVRIIDDRGDSAMSTYQMFDSEQSGGTIQLWIYFRGWEYNAGQTSGLSIQNGTEANLVSIYLYNNELRYVDGSNTVLTGLNAANQWLHLTIDFSCDGTYGGLAVRTYSFRFDLANGSLFYQDPEVFFANDNPGNATRFRISTNTGQWRRIWFDAVGYSWDPDYVIGDNLDEGLLLSFENNTVLDWIGYSLNGLTNKTINGDLVIPYPGSGYHTIQIFGNNSLGTMYQSDIVYFTCAWTEIIIDEDHGPGWAYFKSYYRWCTGSGTEQDPYVIKNLPINGKDKPTCLTIRHYGYNPYFIVKDSTFINGEVGIFLEAVGTRGKIINNKINYTNTGIRVYADGNTNISLNSIYSAVNGILIERSDNNDIFLNSLSTIESGITLDSYSDNNNIYLNTIDHKNNIDNGKNNQWDNGYIGNHWSNYSGFDGYPIDGIGEEPYIVPGISGAIDNFPILYSFNLDADDDGLNNVEEYSLGIDGLRTNPVNPDSDNDGITDYWEWMNSTNALNPDTDSDSFNDGLEIELGTDPTKTSWYPMPNLKVIHFSPVSTFEKASFMIDFSIINIGIWKAEGVIIVVKCEELDFTLFNNTDSPMKFDVDEPLYISISCPSIETNGIYTLNLTIDPYNMINETYSSKDGSGNIDGELDNSQITYLTVLPELKTLNLEVVDQSFSTEKFNITFSVYNESKQQIDFATINMWWNESEVSDNVINLGKGLYFISLEPITVVPGDDPILLKMVISASGYEDKHFETYLAVDPDTLEKGIGQGGKEFPFLILIIALISTVGGIGATIITLSILRKRRPAKEVI